MLANIKYVHIVHNCVIDVSCDFSKQTVTKSKEKENAKLVRATYKMMSHHSKTSNQITKVNHVHSYKVLF